MKRDETDLLVTRWLAGETGPEEEDRLAELLLTDEETRLRFVELADQEAALRVACEGMERARRIREDAPEAVEAVRRERGARTARVFRARRRPFALALVVAAAALVLVALRFLLPVAPAPDPASPAPPREVVREAPSPIPAASPPPPATPGPFPPRPLPPAPPPLDAPRERAPAQRPPAVEPDRSPPEQAPVAHPPESPKPALSDAPATKTQPARPLGSLARIAGEVIRTPAGLARGERSREGAFLLAGDRIDVRSGTARLDLDAKAVVYAKGGTVLRIAVGDTENGEVPLLVLEQGEVYVTDAGRNLHVLTRDGAIVPVGTRFVVRWANALTVAIVEDGAVEVRGNADSRDDPTASEPLKTGRFDLRQARWTSSSLRVEKGRGAQVRAGSAPRAGSFAGQLAPWRFGEGLEILHADGFKDVSGWQWHPYHPKGNLDRQLRRGPARSGTDSFHLRYTFPDVVPGKASENWNENYRALQLPIRVPAAATHVRVWVRALQAKPGAKLYFNLVRPTESWSVEASLDTLPRTWHAVEMDLGAPEYYWSQGGSKTKGGIERPVDSKAVTHVEVGFNYGDQELLLDDLEFVDRGRP